MIFTNGRITCTGSKNDEDGFYYTGGPDGEYHIVDYEVWGLVSY